MSDITEEEVRAERRRGGARLHRGVRGIRALRRAAVRCRWNPGARAWPQDARVRARPLNVSAGMRREPDLAAFLRHLPLFAGLGSAELARVSGME